MSFCLPPNCPACGESMSYACDSCEQTIKPPAPEAQPARLADRLPDSTVLMSEKEIAEMLAEDEDDQPAPPGVPGAAAVDAALTILADPYASLHGHARAGMIPKIRAHLAAQSAEIAALRAEVGELKSVIRSAESWKSVDERVRCGKEQRREARIEALEWARSRCSEMRQRDGDYEQVVTADELDEELNRLRAPGPQ